MQIICHDRSIANCSKFTQQGEVMPYFYAVYWLRPATSVFSFARKCKLTGWDNYHLLTETEGNSVYCEPETVDVSRGEAEGNIDGRGSTKHTAFPRSQSISVLLYKHLLKKKQQIKEEMNLNT